MKSDLIRAEGLTKIYGDKTALDRVSFSVREGSITGFLGPNGAGKTTAIHLMMGILLPDAGNLSVLGLQPGAERRKLAEKINFSSAYIQLPFNLKVKTVLKLYAALYSVRKPAKKIGELCEQFGIAQLLERRVGSLSSGEMTRVNLVKALVNDPRLLFLDEPTASLDPEISERVQTTLLDLHRSGDITVIYTSHNMAEVERLCDHAFFLHQGRIVATGAPADIRRSFRKKSLEHVFIEVVRGREAETVTGAVSRKGVKKK